MKEKTYKIYCLIDPNGEIRYIGQTRQTLPRRLWGHINKNKNSDTHKRRWLNKLEENNLRPTIRLIEECGSLGELNEREIFYIKKYRDEGYDLVNTSDGGTGGNHWANKTKEEQDIIREKLSKTLKGKNKGKKRTEAEKENIRKKLTGRKLPPETILKMRGRNKEKRKRLFEIDGSGNVIKVYESYTKASETNSLYYIRLAIKNNTKYNGVYWKSE